MSPLWSNGIIWGSGKLGSCHTKNLLELSDVDFPHCLRRVIRGGNFKVNVWKMRNKGEHISSDQLLKWMTENHSSVPSTGTGHVTKRRCVEWSGEDTAELKNMELRLNELGTCRNNRQQGIITRVANDIRRLRKKYDEMSEQLHPVIDMTTRVADVTKWGGAIRIASMYPGLETFQTIFTSGGYVLEWGNSIIDYLSRRVERIEWLRNHSSRGFLSDEERDVEMRQIDGLQQRFEEQLTRYCDRLCEYVCDSYDVIVLSEFNPDSLTPYESSMMDNSKVKEMCIWFHSEFRRVLIGRAQSCAIVDVLVVHNDVINGTCGMCGAFSDDVRVSKTKMVKCLKCKSTYSYRANAARNVQIRYIKHLIGHETTPDLSLNIRENVSSSSFTVGNKVSRIRADYSADIYDKVSSSFLGILGGESSRQPFLYAGIVYKGARDTIGYHVAGNYDFSSDTDVSCGLPYTYRDSADFRGIPMTCTRCSKVHYIPWRITDRHAAGMYLLRGDVEWGRRDVVPNRAGKTKMRGINPMSIGFSDPRVKSAKSAKSANKVYGGMKSFVNDSGCFLNGIISKVLGDREGYEGYKKIYVIVPWVLNPNWKASRSDTLRADITRQISGMFTIRGRCGCSSVSTGVVRSMSGGMGRLALPSMGKRPKPKPK